MNHKLVSGGVAVMLMAVPFASPAHPKQAAAAPAGPEVADARSETTNEQQVEADRLERQLPRVSHIKEPVASPPPTPAPAKPVSPYVVRVAPVVYRPFANAAAVAYPRAGGNHFYWGFCTWYVATRRYVPWFGDAAAWAWNAVAYGYRTGYRPLVGAIWQIGNHVAYVEAVFANGSFRISEMNWYQYGGGFGRVDYRTLPPGSGGVFIY